MSAGSFSPAEVKVLLCLLEFYRNIGPAATPAVKGLHEEAGVEFFELDDAVRLLRERGLIEYWELQPAVRLTRAGLEAAVRLASEGGG